MPHINTADKVDKALNEYINVAIKKVDDIVDLLLKAEEAYIMSRNVTVGSEDWRKRRDGFRIEGNTYFEQAEALFNDKLDSAG
jgi:hypothetical protein